MSSVKSFIRGTLMLTTGTPSIVQQRIVLVVLFVVIGAAVWWQNAGGDADHPVQKFSRTPGSDIVELDFSSAEAAWGGLTIDPQGNLQIDALTETALSDAIAIMRDQTSEPASQAAMTRMAFLLEKQFGATASRQIMELLPVLKNYKEVERRFWEENGGRDPPPHAELFQLQDKLLGEKLAQKMFSEQRRLAKTMLASHRIRNDASLTQAEKDRALMSLQQTLQEEGAPIE